MSSGIMSVIGSAVFAELKDALRFHRAIRQKLLDCKSSDQYKVHCHFGLPVVQRCFEYLCFVGSPSKHLSKQPWDPPSEVPLDQEPGPPPETAAPVTFLGYVTICTPAHAMDALTSSIAKLRDQSTAPGNPICQVAGRLENMHRLLPNYH